VNTTDKVEEIPIATQSLEQSADHQEDAHDFFPKGAIAFFAAMLVGFALIWAGLYALMVQRQFHP
jgi:hypothetical protein